MNLRSIPIETTVVDYNGNIIKSADVTIKRKTPTGNIPVDIQTSDELGYVRSIPLSNGIYSLFYQNTFVGSVNHFNDISIPSYKPTEGNYKPKDPFDVLRNANNLMNYALYIQIENDDVTSEGNNFPIYNVPPTDFTEDFFGITQFFGLDNTSRITYTKFDVEFFIPLTSKNDTTRHVRCSGAPGLKFFSDSQIVVPMDYWSMVLKMPIFTGNYTGGSAKAKGDGNLIKVYGTQIEDLLKTLNFGDVIKCTYDDPSNGYPFFYGIVDDINSSNEIILEKYLSTRYNSNYDFLAAEKNLKKIEVFNGLLNLVNTSVFENFTVTENINAQDNVDIYQYDWAPV